MSKPRTPAKGHPANYCFAGTPKGGVLRTFPIAAALLAAAACAPIASVRPPLAAAAANKPMTWADLTARPRPVPDRSFRYGDDPYQVVDLWRPRGRGPHPVALMVHGGCWTTSIADRSLMAWAAADLRARGIAVWNIDYRGVDRPGGAFTGIFDDVGAASDLMRVHAVTERLDLRRVVAIGHSAGGHLGLWLAARPRVPGVFVDKPRNPLPISHVVSLGGLPDLQQAHDEKQGCGRDPIGKLISPDVRLYKTDDPDIRHDLLVDKSIPFLAPLGVRQTLINGDADKIIPTHFAHDYAAKMRAKGDRVTVKIVRDQGHVELIAPGTRAWKAAVKAIRGALRR